MRRRGSDSSQFHMIGKKVGMAMWLVTHQSWFRRALEREIKSGKGFSLVKLLEEKVTWWKDENETVFKDKLADDSPREWNKWGQLWWVVGFFGCVLLKSIHRLCHVSLNQLLYCTMQALYHSNAPDLSYFYSPLNLKSSVCAFSAQRGIASHDTKKTVLAS